MWAVQLNLIVFLVIRVLWATVCAVWEYGPATEL